MAEQLVSLIKNYICCGNCNKYKVKNVCPMYDKNLKENEVCNKHSFDLKTFNQRIKL